MEHDGHALEHRGGRVEDECDVPGSEGLTWFIREATVEDATEIGRHLRDADRLEAEFDGLDPQRAAIETFYASRRAYCVVVLNMACILFGVLDSGQVWMFSTGRIKYVPVRDIVIEARRFRDLFWADVDYRTLFNWVHEDNELHIRFLKFLGATVYAPRNHKRYFELKGEL